MFRSRFIDSLASIERWSVDTWRHLADSAGDKRKVPPHFGNRLKRIRELAKSREALFSTPKDVARLLDRLEPYCRLRATLVHGRFEIATAGEGSILFVIDNPLDEPSDAFAHRVALRGDELNEIMKSLDKLVETLTSQTLSDRPSPSAPPRPKPAAAAGP